MTSSQDTVDLFDAAFIRDPYSAFRKVKGEGSVFPSRMEGVGTVWVVAGYAEARAALTDPRLAKDARHARGSFRDLEDPAGQEDPEFVMGRHMLSTDPPDHTRLRKIVSTAFTPRRVEALRPRIEQISRELLDALDGRDTADLLGAYAFPLPITVICELLGVPDGERDSFRTWSNDIVSDADFERSRASVRAILDYFGDLVAVKRKRPGDDLISALITATDEGDRLSERELLSTLFLLLIAGHETTVNLIGNGMLALLGHPDQLAALRADLELVPQAVEEFLRFDGPVNLATARFTTEEVELAGARIPANTMVLVALSAADHDDRQFDDAGRLDITRRPGGHLAFGHGIHYCLGAPLARLEGQIAIRDLLTRFPGLALDASHADLEWQFSTLIRGLKRLPVRLR
ncbi:cytochrome P450 family protein [Allonocardiopsis opalescens]|uniref:Cytochrome P450 n=1 Tax=Allonocardiopsis opalescens TaxID=1144618 RepID=A0A2T0Q0H7_9ACTN|nr:cytochrome P450 [Allonocardiopsis opalescens]PRX97297.1 cytochrome P450 [Allonocardiopsis opalescens]